MFVLLRCYLLVLKKPLCAPQGTSSPWRATEALVSTNSELSHRPGQEGSWGRRKRKEAFPSAAHVRVLWGHFLGGVAGSRGIKSYPVPTEENDTSRGHRVSSIPSPPRWLNWRRRSPWSPGADLAPASGSSVQHSTCPTANPEASPSRAGGTGHQGLSMPPL